MIEGQDVTEEPQQAKAAGWAANVVGIAWAVSPPAAAADAFDLMGSTSLLSLQTAALASPPSMQCQMTPKTAAVLLTLALCLGAPAGAARASGRRQLGAHTTQQPAEAAPTASAAAAPLPPEAAPPFSEQPLNATPPAQLTECEALVDDLQMNCAVRCALRVWVVHPHHSRLCHRRLFPVRRLRLGRLLSPKAFTRPPARSLDRIALTGYSRGTSAQPTARQAATALAALESAGLPPRK